MAVPKKIFTQKLAPLITPELALRVQGVYIFELTGPEGGTWRIDLKNQPGIYEGRGTGGDLTLTLTVEDFTAMTDGALNPQIAIVTGRMQVQGELALVLKLHKVLGLI